MRKSQPESELRDTGSGQWSSLPRAQAPPRRFIWPSWAISLLLHGTLLVVLGMTIRWAPLGAANETSRVVGLVLKHHEPQGDYYESEQDAQQLASDAADASDLSEAIAGESPVDPTDALPDSPNAIGPAALDRSLNPGVGELTGRPRAESGITSGEARTKVFGVEGEGYKFVYVFDRSGSMGGSVRSPLNAAKAELLRSLESLGETHQFQIIFYNEEPMIFPLAGRRQKLVFGNQANRQRARRFVGSITADGATRHERALKRAQEHHAAQWRSRGDSCHRVWLRSEKVGA